MDFFNDKSRGWYWHEELPIIEEPEPEPEPEPQPVAPPAPPIEPINSEITPVTPAGPAPMSAEWLREEMPKALDAAIDSPTKENVKKYFYMHRLMMDKADEFSEVAQYVTMMDPILAEKDKAPRSDGGSTLQAEISKNNKKKMLAKLAKKVGIYFVFMSDCPFCHKQVSIIQLLKRKYGFIIKSISMDGLPMPNMGGLDWIPDGGHAKKLGVTMTPGIFFVKPGKELEVSEISQGYISLSEFEKIALFQGKEFGWITESDFNSTKTVKPSRIKPDVLEKYKNKKIEKSEDVIQMIQEAIDAQL